MKKKLIFIATFICSLNIWCTEITEVVTKQVGDNIEIKYSIADADPSQMFDVSIYCSVDGEPQAQPLTSVTGDVGKDIIGNGAKSVTWNVIEEYGALHGNVKFKVVALPTKKLEATTSLLNGTKVSVKSCKQVGDKIVVSLSLQNGEQPVRFDLYTNYIKATGNNGQELYAVSYILGSDVVSSKRPIGLKSNQERVIVVNFESTESLSYLKTLELESRFPSDLAFIKNIVISK
jgi:hypothetical protein